MGQGPSTSSKKAQEDLARQDEENIQVGLTLSHEEARHSGLFAASSEALVGPVSMWSTPLELVPSSIPVRDIKDVSESPNPTLEPVIFEVPDGEGIRTNAAVVQGSPPRRDADPSGAGAPVCRGVLGSTFGEASSYPSSEQIFHQTFDIEARAMKILGNLLPVQSKGIRECHALGLASTLDEEGRGAGERILLEFLPNMWKELSELEERIR